MQGTCLYCQTEFDYNPHHTSGKYCNNQCQGNHTKEKWFIDNQSLFEAGELKSRRQFKKFVIRRDGDKCSLCNQEAEWQGKQLTMVIDHIDGDSTNNMPSNFRLVCPNCDSQLPTFKGANRGNGRATKGKLWNDRL